MVRAGTALEARAATDRSARASRGSSAYRRAKCRCIGCRVVGVRQQSRVPGPVGQRIPTLEVRRAPRACSRALRSVPPRRVGRVSLEAPVHRQPRGTCGRARAPGHRRDEIGSGVVRRRVPRPADRGRLEIGRDRHRAGEFWPRGVLVGYAERSSSAESSCARCRTGGRSEAHACALGRDRARPAGLPTCSSGSAASSSPRSPSQQSVVCAVSPGRAPAPASQR